MLLSRKRNLSHPPQLLLNKAPLEQVEAFKYLGVLISSDLSWSRHIDSICAKGKRLIGLLYRRFSTNVSSERLIEMYKYLVRPHLEYAAPVWDPHLLKDIKSVENVQKYGLKMCLKRWDLGYQELLHLAQIPTLENRRIYLKLCTLFKIIMVSSLSHPMYLCRNLVDITIIFHFCINLFHTLTPSKHHLFQVLFPYGITYPPMHLLHLHLTHLS